MNTKMTKHILLLIASGYFIVSLNAIGQEPAKAHQTEKEAQCVVITYRHSIESFDVRILWRPREQMSGYLIGPAILEFNHKDPKKGFALTNNRFGLPDSDEWMKTVTIKDGYYVKTSQPHLVVDYAVPDMMDKLPSTCVFFIDFNFDGKKELVLTEFANGQRFRNTYQVYDLDEIGNSKSNTTTAQEPFASMDSESKVDFKDRTIRLFNSSGANLSEQLLYKFDEALGRYHLTKCESTDKD